MGSEEGGARREGGGKRGGGGARGAEGGGGPPAAPRPAPPFRGSREPGVRAAGSQRPSGGAWAFLAEPSPREARCCSLTCLTCRGLDLDSQPQTCRFGLRLAKEQPLQPQSWRRGGPTGAAAGFQEPFWRYDEANQSGDGRRWRDGLLLTVLMRKGAPGPQGKQQHQKSAERMRRNMGKCLYCGLHRKEEEQRGKKARRSKHYAGGRQLEKSPGNLRLPSLGHMSGEDRWIMAFWM
ncbi:uncharacterized protein LOC144321552 [Canis aureus]